MLERKLNVMSLLRERMSFYGKSIQKTEPGAKEGFYRSQEVATRPRTRKHREGRLGRSPLLSALTRRFVVKSVWGDVLFRGCELWKYGVWRTLLEIGLEEGGLVSK